MSGSYSPKEIEPKWQTHWDIHKTFRTPNPGERDFDASRRKFYALDMFPYPSGAGLHVGHPEGYTATDIIARYRRMQGYNVLHPMGWDAFGLPAEQHAVETGTHPAQTTRKNIDTFRRQLKMLGFSYDWDRELSTTHPNYYRWTQWIFLKLFNSWYDDATNKARPISELPIPADVRSSGDKAVRDYIDGRRLAYLAEVPVNWCPALGTVLANEEVTNDGRSERGNHPVFKRPMRQWMLRITKYGERLEKDLQLLDWPESVKIMQRNWIGRSEGAQVKFKLDVFDDVLEIFTTRPDTLFGATYMVLAPEHPLIAKITTAAQREKVQAYCTEAARRTDLARTAEAKEKTGVFTGAFAINPVNGERIPIWTADYVLMTYGTGAIMAVPAHDTRDYEFAKQFDLPIRDVVYPPPVAAMRYFTEHAIADERKAGLWKDVLADFLAGVTTSTETFPDHFAEAMTRVRQRPFHPKTAIDPSAGNKRTSGDDSKEEVAILATWLEALDSMHFSDIDDLRETFAKARFYDRAGAAYVGQGINVNSAGHVSLDNLHTPEAKKKIIGWLTEQKLGRGVANYKLRDWLFSRQRYWGEPFPILHGPEGEIVALDESDLPLQLPELADFRPTAMPDDSNADPVPPLGRAKEWITVHREGRTYRRELNTMPQWAGSCWYYLRFMDARNTKRFCSSEAEHYWMVSPKKDGTPHAGGIDLYLGGAEHAVLHLLYSRFWHKVLFDLGYVSTPEPFGKLFNQGMIRAFAYKDSRGVYIPYEDIDFRDDGAYHQQTNEKLHGAVEKMSKSLKNVINPEEVVNEYGADSLRLYEMFMGPLDASKPWNPRDVPGVFRFLQRAWRMIVNEESGELAANVTKGDINADLEKSLHKTIKKVGEDMDRMAFNTAISSMMEFVNEVYRAKGIHQNQAERFTLIIAPFAPHLAEELWQRLRGKEWRGSLAYEKWPTYDNALVADDVVEIPVQVNGKVAGRITVAKDASEDTAKSTALADVRVQTKIGSAQVVKTIYVPGRMLNLVVKS